MALKRKMVLFLLLIIILVFLFLFQASMLPRNRGGMRITQDNNQEYRPQIIPKIVIGIPTTLRARTGTSMLRNNLAKLFNGLSPEEKKNHRFVVGNAERDLFSSRIVEEEIRSSFGKEISQGLLELVNIPSSFYPRTLVLEPCKLKQNFGDTLLRVIWRSKQVIDTVYLMNYCKDKGDWYLELEDDNPPLISNWSTKIIHFENQNFVTHDWDMLRFYLIPKHRKEYNKLNKVTKIKVTNRFAYSFGLLYKTKDLEPLINFLYNNYDEMPLDWLIGHYFVSNSIEKVFQGPPWFEHNATANPSTKKRS